MDVEDKKKIVVNLAPFWQRPYLCIYPLVCVKREGVGALAVGHGLGSTHYASTGFGDGCWISSNGYRKSAIGEDCIAPVEAALTLPWRCVARV